MDSFSFAVLMTKFGSTCFMVGLIWFVQIVHYPLFGQVGEADFSQYAESHQQKTSFVVIPPMLAELITTFLLLWLAPKDLSTALLWLSAVLVVTIWLTTFFEQVPRHTKLLDGFDQTVINRLVLGNWIRTIAWSLRGIVVVALVYQAFLGTRSSG